MVWEINIRIHKIHLLKLHFFFIQTILCDYDKVMSTSFDKNLNGVRIIDYIKVLR